jgi:hypothetical protein
MSSVESKSMDRPDETHSPDKLVASVVHLGAVTVKRLRAEPGFRWSECVKPSSGGEKLPVRSPWLRRLGQTPRRYQ